MNMLIKNLLTLTVIAFAYTSHADRIMSIQEFLELKEEELALVMKICSSDETQKHSENCKNAYRAWQIKIRKPKVKRSFQED